MCVLGRLGVRCGCDIEGDNEGRDDGCQYDAAVWISGVTVRAAMVLSGGSGKAEAEAEDEDTASGV